MNSTAEDLDKTLAAIDAEIGIEDHGDDDSPSHGSGCRSRPATC